MGLTFMKSYLSIITSLVLTSPLMAASAVSQEINLHHSRHSVENNSELVAVSTKSDRAIALESFNGEDAGFYYGRGTDYAKQGKLQQAISDYNRAVEIDPQFAKAYFGRGFVYAKQGKNELALADYDQAIQLDPKLANVYYNRALIYVAQGQTQQALDDYSQVIKLNPEDSEAYYNRGRIYARQGQNSAGIR